MSRSKNIAVDLDGTLAYYDGWRGPEHIGPPIPAVVERVKRALADGARVWVFTARLAGTGREADIAARVIEQWCVNVFGQELPMTCMKLPTFTEFWDDRAVRVVSNSGKTVAGGPLWDAYAPGSGPLFWATAPDGDG